MLRIYPGVIFGLALFVTGQFYGLNRGRSRLLSLVIIMSAAVIGWRAALDIGYMHGKEFPMLTAGAVGALTVAIGLVAAWPIRRWIIFLLFVTIIGTAAGEIARLIWEAFPALGDDLWLLILFIEWQSMLMFAVAGAILWLGIAQSEA